MSRVDLSLPDKVPEMARYHEEPSSLHPFALYALIDCADDIPALIERSNSECPKGDSVQQAPQVMFQSGSLKEVMEYHLGLAKEGDFDPRWFLVITEKCWKKKGVVVVTLDDDDLNCKPDLFRTKIEDSGMLLVNLQIANTDWYEAKETYELPSSGDDDIAVQSEETSADGAPRKKPGPGFYIGFYAVPDIDPEELIKNVQPAYDEQPTSDYTCRFEGQLKPDQDPARQAMTTCHPQQCKINPYLHESMLFVADRTDYKSEGLLMCDIKRNRTRRVSCDVHTLVPNFCDIARGQMDWDD